MGKFLGVLAGVGFFIAMVLVISLICGVPVMLLWNWLMPTIFNLPKIDFCQAMGLVMLSSIFFKSNNTKND